MIDTSKSGAHFRPMAGWRQAKDSGIPTVDNDNDNRYHSFMQLRMTAQRQAILELIESTDRHWDAEAIVHALRKAGHPVGIATVYRTLSALEDRGRVRSVQLAGGKRYYERAGKRHHDHFICEGCGLIIEFSHPAVSQILDRLSEENEVLVLGRQFTVFGRCAACAGDAR